MLFWYRIIYKFTIYVLAECWVKFLQNINKSFINNAQLMLSVWLRQELEKNVISRTPSDREY